MPAKSAVVLTAAFAVAPFSPAAHAATATQPLYGSLDELTTTWNAAAAHLESLDPSLDQFELDTAAFAVAPLPVSDALGAYNLFSTPIHTNGFVGGLVDPATGSVLAAVVGGDPDASIVRGAVGILMLTAVDPSAPGLTEMGQAWANFADNYKTVPAEYAVAGDVGLFMQTFPGAEADDETISVVASTAQDEMAAFTQAYSLTIAAGLQAVDAPAAPTATATTLATAAPSVTTAPATTVLPAPSLATMPAPSVPTPGVTAVPASTTPAPPMTTGVPVAGAMFASIEDFIARWNEQTETVPVGPDIDLTMRVESTGLLVGEGPGGTDAFATWIGESAIVGGLADAVTGTVQQLLIAMAPRGVAVSGVTVTSANLVAADDNAEYLTAFAELISAEPGTTRYLVAGDNDIVLSVESGFFDSQLIAVAVAPVTDEAAATANADEVLEVVFSAAQIAASG